MTPSSPLGPRTLLGTTPAGQSIYGRAKAPQWAFAPTPDYARVKPAAPVEEEKEGLGAYLKVIGCMLGMLLVPVVIVLSFLVPPIGAGAFLLLIAAVWVYGVATGSDRDPKVDFWGRPLNGCRQ